MNKCRTSPENPKKKKKNTARTPRLVHEPSRYPCLCPPSLAAAALVADVSLSRLALGIGAAGDPVLALVRVGHPGPPRGFLLVAGGPAVALPAPGALLQSFAFVYGKLVSLST